VSARRLVVTLGLVTGALVTTSPMTFAKPTSIWDDPKSTEKSAPSELAFAHKWAMELLQTALSEGGLHGAHAGEANAAMVNARDLLVRYGAETSSDVRLRFDLGRMLVELAEWKRAIPVLQSALALAGDDHPSSEDAWFSLAISYAHLGEREREVAAYLRALPLEDSPYGRHVILSNLAEARMGLGQLDLAIEAGEAALEIDTDSALLHWTMAVVRDRAGDTYGSMLEGKIAIGLDPFYGQLESADVFFEPAWERHWYLALGELAHAEASLDKVDVELHLLSAIRAFDKYLNEASPDDRWRKLAAEHVLRIEARLGLAKLPTSKPIGKPKP